MKLFGNCCVAALAGLSLPALACEHPPVVDVPDGATATREEMLDAQQAVNTYMQSMDDYLTCLNEELEDAGDDAPDQFQALMVTRHNSAVSEMEAVADAFNEQLGAFSESSE